MKQRKVEFMPPKDFQLPEGSNTPGDEFSMLCDFRVTPTGVCLVKMGDTEMPGYDEKGESRKPYSAPDSDQSQEMTEKY